MRQNQYFYKNPQNSFGQVAPPGYVNNQRVTQKSSLEILMESYVMNQSKQLQELKNQTGFLNDSLSKLNTKVWRWEKPQEGGGGWIVFLETSSFTF